MEVAAHIIADIEQAQAEADGIVIPGRDRPLDFHWRVPATAAARTGWKVSGDRDFDQAMRSIMAALVLAGRAEEWISYSRRREWYSTGVHYQGTAYTFDRIIGAVDELLCLGLVEEERARPGDHLRAQRQSRQSRQSRMRATPKLIDAFAGVSLEYDVRETLRMRDANGDPVAYRETAKTIAMRSDLECLNRAMKKVRLELPGEGVVIEGNLIRVDGAIIRMTEAPQFYRVFSRGRWTCNGRIQWWGQNLPASRRADLLIDGQPVVELDYASLHPRMLYAKRGATLDFDPYDVQEFDRSLSKRALLVALNARHLGQAVAALCASTSRDGTAWPLDWTETRRLVDAVIARNPAIAADIGSDAGIGLMHEDSELAMRVVKACAKLDVTCLPVHDSFIVQARHEAVLREIMDEEIQRYETRARAAYEASKKAAETVIENSVPRHCEQTEIRPGIPHIGVWGVGGVGEGSTNEVSREGRRGSEDGYVEVIDCRTRPSYDRAESERRQKAFECGETKTLIRVPGEMEHLLWPMYGRDASRVVFEFYRSERNSWANFNSAWRGQQVPTEDRWYASERKKRLARQCLSEVAQDRPSSLSSACH
jgi:hypothetical protein